MADNPLAQAVARVEATVRKIENVPDGAETMLLPASQSGPFAADLRLILAALHAAREDAGRYSNLVRKSKAHRRQIRGMQAKIQLLNIVCEKYAAQTLVLRQRTGELTAELSRAARAAK